MIFLYIYFLFFALLTHRNLAQFFRTCLKLFNNELSSICFAPAASLYFSLFWHMFYALYIGTELW